MTIKFSLYIEAKSSSYEELRFNDKTCGGILVLPSLRTLGYYQNYIKTKEGFNAQVFADLKQKTQCFLTQKGTF